MLSKIPYTHLHGSSLGEEKENAAYPYGVFSSFQWDAVYIRKIKECFKDLSLNT